MKSVREINPSRSQKPIYRDTNLQIIFCVTLTAVLAITVITPAFPKIVQELNISPQDVGLLISVFAFPGIILTPVLGVLSDGFVVGTDLGPTYNGGYFWHMGNE